MRHRLIPQIAVSTLLVGVLLVIAASSAEATIF